MWFVRSDDFPRPASSLQFLRSDRARHEAARSGVKAKGYGVQSVPAVVVDGKLADCCAGRGPQEQALRAAGIGAKL